MNLVSIPAVIYKINKYSDHSAIALAFTSEFGKVKLFVSRAYTKKGGLMRFIPGVLSYTSKESSDLFKFRSFSHNNSYYSYLQTPEIISRLHLLFDFFDKLYDTGQPSKAFWSLLLRYQYNNYRELSIYALYRLFKSAGIMFDTEPESIKENFIHNKLDPDNSLILKISTITNNDLYREITFSGEEEIKIYELFSKHADNVLGGRNVVKSLDIFKTLSFYIDDGN